jgi:threonyl-tRNA synthetase
VRRLGSQEHQVMTLDAAIRMLADEAIPPDRRRSAKSKAA